MSHRHTSPSSDDEPSANASVQQRHKASRSDAASDAADQPHIKRYTYKPPPAYKRPAGFMPMPKVRPHKVWTWSVMITALAVIVFFLMNRVRRNWFARHKEQLQLRTHFFECSADYAAEMRRYPAGCAPPKCGRLVSDTLLEPTDVDRLLDLAQDAFRLDGIAPTGPARLDVDTGALYAGQPTAGDGDQPLGRATFKAEHLQAIKTIRKRIGDTIAEHFGVTRDALHLTGPATLDRRTATEAAAGKADGQPHADDQTHPAFHYSARVFLGGFKREFTGGRLVFIDGLDNKTHTIVEPKRGRLLAFTSGRENSLHVEPVTSGQRLTLTVAFTCDERRALQPAVQTD